jgi:hypothetical protein
LSIRVRAPIAAWVTPSLSAITATSRHSGIESPNSASYVRDLVVGVDRRDRILQVDDRGDR